MLSTREFLVSQEFEAEKVCFACLVQCLKYDIFRKQFLRMILAMFLNFFHDKVLVKISCYFC